MKTLFLDPPTPMTKSQLKDALQDFLENFENWLSCLKRIWVSHVAFKNGNSANIFAKQFIEIAKKCYSRILLSYSDPLRIYH